MTKAKKIIAAMLTFMMILSLTANTGFASVSQDVKNTEYETEAQVLGALEIMVGDANTGAFRPNDPIKRSEATKIAVALMGLTSMANSQGSSLFPDVANDYWAKGFINTAKSHGLVIGDDTGNFRAEDQIKFSEVVTILIRALGYEPQAKTKGGYPGGYIATASSIGLTDGVSAGADTLISRGKVAIMAYNALKINLMEQTGFGSNVKYEVTDKTLLKDKLNTTLIKGKVNAVGSSVLDGSAPLSKNQIKIGNTVYDAGKTDTRTILGFNADAYYSQKTKKIIAIVPTEGENSVLTIDAENIDKIENTLSSKAVHYRKDIKDQKTIKANVEKDATIVYNGKIADGRKFALIDSGYMALLDTNSNGSYDIVFVNETVNYVIDDVLTSSKKITDKYGNASLTLDFEDESKTIILEKGGEYIALSDLKEWDVISFTISEGSDIIFGNVVRESAEGKISEIEDGAVYINGIKYKVASNYPGSLTIGDEGVFYLDFEGKIAAFDGTKQKSQNYAYLINTGISTGIKKVLSIEVFTAEGKIETLEGSEKISVNSSKNLDAQAAKNAIGSTGKLITIEKDASGKVKKISTSTSAGDINEDVFTLNMEENDVVYRASSSKLTGSSMSVSITEETIIFDIPDGASKEEYSVRKRDIFTDGALYDVAIYDVSETYRAGALVVKNSKSQPDEASDVAVVEKINSMQNSNGETIHRLYALMGGKSVTFTSKNDTTFKKESGKYIKEGDIIQLRTNAEGIADSIKVLFDSEAEVSEGKVKISDDLSTVYGKVVKKFSDSVNIQTGSATPENYEISKATVYVYDKTLSKNKLSVGDTADIERYDDNGGKVFMRIYKDEVKEIVVIK